MLTFPRITVVYTYTSKWACNFLTEETRILKGNLCVFCWAVHWLHEKVYKCLCLKIFSHTQSSIKMLKSDRLSWMQWCFAPHLCRFITKSHETKLSCIHLVKAKTLCKHHEWQILAITQWINASLMWFLTHTPTECGLNITYYQHSYLPPLYINCSKAIHSNLHFMESEMLQL